MTDSTPFAIAIADAAVHCSAPTELTIYQAQEAYAQLQRLMPFDKDICIDFANTHELDTCGVQLLIALHKALANDGFNLQLINISTAVTEVLQLFNCDLVADEEDHHARAN